MKGKKVDIKYEIRSFITTFLAWLLTESFWNLDVFIGNFSMDSFKALFGAIIRALLKTLIVASIPKFKTLIKKAGAER